VSFFGFGGGVCRFSVVVCCGIGGDEKKEGDLGGRISKLKY
jgi:hypothetical protein